MDAYNRSIRKQNAGIPCEHCNSQSGHFALCPLLNRAAAEEMSTLSLNSEDLRLLEDLHILL